MAYPRYEVLTRTFIEPEMLAKGCIIEFEGAPGPHLFPLNEEAKARMESWYDEEYPFFDSEGEPVFYMNEAGERVQKMYHPHAQYRRVEAPKIERARFNLVEGPPGPRQEDLNHTLAGLGLKQATPDVRPGPDRMRSDPDPVLASISEDEPQVRVLKATKTSPKELALELRGAEG